MLALTLFVPQVRKFARISSLKLDLPMRFVAKMPAPASPGVDAGLFPGM